MNTSTPSVETILAEAVEIAAPAQRQAFVEQACGGNLVLQRRLEQLIANHFQAGSFLERPAAAMDPGGTAAWEIAGPAHGPGTVIGPYKLLEQIGEGGMGLVYVAEQQHPIKRRVALKIIKPGMDSRQVIARFEAERQALAMMDHPNIAKVFDAGATNTNSKSEARNPKEEGATPLASDFGFGASDLGLGSSDFSSGRPYFVMELVKGIPITDYCDKHRLNTRQRLELFVDVCHALQHAHRKGIIHRDLKPSNVLVSVHDVTPVVKVIDFGIAKAIGGRLTDKTVYTAFAQMVGTPLYMSPEQAGLSDLDVDTRSDVYSLGVLLYELLTGTTPFDLETLKNAGYDEMRRIIREDEPPRPSTRLSTMQQAALSTIAEQRALEPRRLSQQLRGELDWIVMKALEKDRDRRYESASALAADVQRYLNDEPVQACPPSKIYRLRKFVRRHKAGLGVAAVLLMAVSLGGSSWLWWAQKRAAAEREARVALREASELQEAERWPEALSAARRADGVLAGVGADAGLRQQVHVLIEDLQMARRLQEAQLRMASVKDGHFDWEACAVAYEAAFREYGLDVDGLDPGAAAEQIRARPIHRRLVAALDDWADTQRQQKAGEWRHRLAVARASDPDTWRNRLRDALEGKDPKAVEELAAAGLEEEWSVQTLELLGRLAYKTASAERVAVLLARAQQRRPGDFWINQSLLSILHASRPRRLEEEIRFASVAVALQPQSPGTHVNLGIVLHDKGRLDEAEAQYREAIRLKKDYAEAHRNLGNALSVNGQLDEAIAEYREAIRLKKDYAAAHNSLGNALHDKGERDEAVAEYREAIRLKKDDVGAHYNLGNTLKAKGQLDEAIAEYREAIRLNKDSAQAHNSLAWLLATCPDVKFRDRGQALAHAKEAVELARADGDMWNTLGVTQYRDSDWKAAVAALMKSVQLRKGGDSSDFFFLAMAHWQLDEKAKARAWYDQAVAWMAKHNPQDEELKRFRVEAAAVLGLAKAADAQINRE